MGMTKIWNVTDNPKTDVVSQNLMVLGKVVKPGRFVSVDEALLVKAHKVTKDVKAGLLLVSKVPPAYLKAKVSAKVPAGATRSHGAAAVVEDASVTHVVETVLVEHETVEEATPALESTPAPTDGSEPPPMKGKKDRKRW